MLSPIELMAFDYPKRPHRRKHGPAGYKDYESYRPWLRDEFCFRCVFCLRREQWSLVVGNWDIDHFQPQSQAPEKALDYENLLYVCRTCNGNKSDNLVADPCDVAIGDLVRVDADGVITSLNEEGELLIQILRLNNADYTSFRRRMLRILAAVEQQEPETYAALMGYPDELPNLGQLKPPEGNSRPESVADSCWIRRENGELPEIY